MHIFFHTYHSPYMHKFIMHAAYAHNSHDDRSYYPVGA